MRWPFSTKIQPVDHVSRDSDRDLKIIQSQHALLEAATSTADAANFVTTKLKARLDDSVNQFENTARILNDALIITDLDGRIQAFNPAAEKMFEIVFDKIKNTFIGNLLLKLDIPFSSSYELWKFFEETEDLNAGLWGIRESGKFRVDVNHTRLDRSDGSSIMLMILRDMTCETENTNYRSIFENNFDGILVVENQKIVAANPAATKLFGYKVEDLLSTSLDTFCDLGGIKHKDGYLMDLSFTSTNICWNDGPATLVTIRNTTRAQQSSEKLICCFDTDFKITFANNSFSKFYSIKKENIIGHDIRELMPEDECNPFLINIGSLTPLEPTRKMQLYSTDDNGNQKIQSWTDHANYDEVEVEYQRIGSVTEVSMTKSGPSILS